MTEYDLYEHGMELLKMEKEIKEAVWGKKTTKTKKSKSAGTKKSKSAKSKKN